MGKFILQNGIWQESDKSVEFANLELSIVSGRTNINHTIMLQTELKDRWILSDKELKILRVLGQSNGSLEHWF